MKTIYRKTVLIALVAALGLASLPFVSASAAGQSDPTPPPQGPVTTDRLERVWAHQLLVYARMGRADQFVEKIQRLIDRAEANGKDVSAVQTALDAFEAALKQAKPIYESTGGIVNSHLGFDDNGKVTDAVKALETVTAMRGKFKEIRDIVGDAGKALREAIRAFREANPRPQGTPTP